MTPDPLTHEELRAAAAGLQMPVRSRFDGITLGRSAFNVMAAALGLPVEAAWADTDQGLWGRVAGWAINFVENAAVKKEDIQLDDFANKIAGYMGSEYGVQSAAERVAWASIARLWGNAIKSLDGDLFEIEREAIGWAMRRIEQTKPVPPPEVKPHTNGQLSHSVIDSVEKTRSQQRENSAPNGHPLPKQQSTSGFGQVIDLQIADYEAKIAGLKELKKQLAPNTQAALFDLINNLTKGE